MASPRPYLEYSLAEWLDELAGDRHAPGGGSALGFGLAMASAVLAMAARVSKSPPLLAQAEQLQARTAPLAQLDADSYDEALAARDGAEALKPAQRDYEIGKAFAQAAEPPLEIARAGADVAELAAELASSGDPLVRADALAAGWLGAAAARAAVALVAVNLTALPGDERVEEAEGWARAAEDAVRRVRA
jgi:methenyltetrahydrofolate cyclohydrolase